VAQATPGTGSKSGNLLMWPFHAPSGWLLQGFRSKFTDVIAAEAAHLDAVPAAKITEPDLIFRPDDFPLAPY
jgi:hypothetical protein